MTRKLAGRDTAVSQLLERAAALGHSGRSFLDHLYGTWRILGGWRAPAAACRAGLFHSAYSTESYRYALLSLQQRRSLRDAIGRESERLVFRFCTMERRGYWDALARRHRTSPLFYRQRLRPHLAVPISRTALVQLLIIESANVAEQTWALDGGPAPWMSRVFGWWRFLDDRELPLSLGKRPSLSLRRDNAAIAAYQKALTSSGQNAAAWLDRTIMLNPWAGEPHLLRALCARDESATKADTDLAAGVRLLCAWAVSWDKRLSLDAWKALASRVAGDSRIYGRRTLTFDAIRQVLLGQARPPKWLVSCAPLQPRSTFRFRRKRVGEHP